MIRIGIALGIMVVMLSGCGRLPTASEDSGKKKPNPIHLRDASTAISR